MSTDLNVVIQDAVEQAEAIRCETERLIAFLRTLTEEDWYRQTDLGDWQVRDIVMHLADRAIGFYGATMERGIAGNVTPPPEFDMQPVADMQTGRKGIEERAIARRSDDLGSLVDLLAERSAKFVALQSGIKIEDLDKPCWGAMINRPVRLIGPIITMESAIHSRDIRSLFGDEPELCAESRSQLRRYVLEVLSTATQQENTSEFVAQQTGDEPAIRMRLTVSDGETSQRDLVLEDDTLRAEQPSGAPVDGEFACDSETFILVMYKRMTLEEAISNDRLQLTVPEEPFTRFKNWLADVVISGLH